MSRRRCAGSRRIPARRLLQWRCGSRSSEKARHFPRVPVPGTGTQGSPKCDAFRRARSASGSPAVAHRLRRVTFPAYRCQARVRKGHRSLTPSGALGARAVHEDVVECRAQTHGQRAHEHGGLTEARDLDPRGQGIHAASNRRTGVRSRSPFAPSPPPRTRSAGSATAAIGAMCAAMCRATSSTTVRARGCGIEFGTAREVALKLTETCRVAAEPLTATDLAHGPIAALDSMFPVWRIASRDESLPAVLEAAARVIEAGATVVASGNAATEITGAAHVLPVPQAPLPILSPLLGGGGPALCGCAGACEGAGRRLSRGPQQGHARALTCREHGVAQSS